MITLKFYSKDGEKFLGERRYRVPSKGLIIGRGSEADVMLQDKYVSRKHSMIYYRDGNYYIRDLGSRNGTYVNGERVQETLIKEGDRIVIGNYEISFEISGPEFSFLDPKILIPTISLVAIIVIGSIMLFTSNNKKINYSILRKPVNPEKATLIYQDTKKDIENLFSKKQVNESDLDTILQKLEEAKKYDPTNLEVLETLSSLKIIKGDIKDILEDVEYLYQSNPDDKFFNFIKEKLDSIAKAGE